MKNEMTIHEEIQKLRRHLIRDHRRDLRGWRDAGIALLRYWHRLEHEAMKREQESR